MRCIRWRERRAKPRSESWRVASIWGIKAIMEIPTMAWTDFAPNDAGLEAFGTLHELHPLHLEDCRSDGRRRWVYSTVPWRCSRSLRRALSTGPRTEGRLDRGQGRGVNLGKITTSQSTQDVLHLGGHRGFCGRCIFGGGCGCHASRSRRMGEAASLNPVLHFRSAARAPCPRTPIAKASLLPSPWDTIHSNLGPNP